jgi:hypothetical protein
MPGLNPNPTPHIQDLRRLFFGGGRDEEYAFYRAAAEAGITGADLLSGNASLPLIVASQQGLVTY